jgi:hypothetical protein
MKSTSMMILLWLGVLTTNQLLAADAKPPAKVPVESKEKDKAKPAAAKTANDQLVLDATVVTGNRELPKVMYIVPWKKADLSNLPGPPFNTLIDETLAPVDREVFRRQVDYYEVISDKDRAAADRVSGPATTPTTDRK